MLEATGDLCVCGEAGHRQEAWPLIEAHRPDLIIVDASLRSGNGLALCKEIRKRHPEMPVLLMSIYTDEDLYAPRAMRAGARGYVVKSCSGEELIEAIQTLLRGKMYYPKTLPAKCACVVHEKLTDRELEVFRLTGQGRSTSQIAAGFGVSVKTVEAHMANIKEKLHLGTRNQLMQTATLWLQNLNAVALAPAGRTGAVGRRP